MDLLLQAARMLELEHSGDSRTDCVATKSARGANFHQYAKLKDDNENADETHHFSDTGSGPLDDMGPSAEKRRAGGAGTREVHNQLEKNRRKQLRDCFNHLRQCVPTLENKRVATQSILQGAIKYIKHLKKKDVEQERDIQMLAKRKSELKKKHDTDFNKCLGDGQRLAEGFIHVKSEVDTLQLDVDGHTSDSTTTASEGPGNDDDDLSDVDEGDGSADPYTNNVDIKYWKGEGFRKRKNSSKSESVSSKPYDVTAGRIHSVLSKHINSKGQPSSSAAAAAMSSSSSVALKQMLEQRKKQQVNVGTQALRSPGTSKGSGKPVSNLTSSYPMISTHLASVPKAKSSSPAVNPVSMLHNSLRPLGLASEMAAADKVTATGSAGVHPHSPPSRQYGQPSGPGIKTENVKTGQGKKREENTKAPQLVSSKANPIPTSLAASKTSTVSLPSQVSTPNSTADHSSGLASPVKPQTSNSVFPTSFTIMKTEAGGITLGTVGDDKQKGNPPFLGQYKPHFAGGSLETPAALPPTAKLGFSPQANSSPNLQPQLPLGQLMDDVLVNNKMLPVIPASLTSVIRTLPINSTIPPRTATPSSNALTLPASSGQRLLVPDGSSQLLTANLSQPVGPRAIAPSPTKTEGGMIPLALTSTNKNTGIAALLAAPPPMNPAVRPGVNLIGEVTMPQSLHANPVTISMSNAQNTVTLNPSLFPLAMTATPQPHQAPTRSMSLSDSQKAINLTQTLIPLAMSSTSNPAATATITFSEAQKSMALAPTILPLTMASGLSQTTTSPSGISSGTPIRFFTPLNPNSMMTSLSNGQTHLMPTMVQFGAPGQVAVLQNIIPAHSHLLAQPIIVMTTSSPAPSSSQTAGTKGTTATSTSLL